MRATVKAVNPRRGRYAAQIHDDEAYVIFELLDSDELEIGDEVRHTDFYSMGGETYLNITQQCSIEVYVQNVCGANLVKRQLLL